MDLGTIIIGIICIVICALPFVLTNKNKKKKEKELLDLLKDFAKEHNSEITNHEIGEHYAIGIDESKNAISFLQKTKEKNNLQYVDLTTIKSCEISNISKSLGKNETTLDKLNLKLNAIDKNKPNVILEFYNSDISFQPVNEFDVIEKWNKLIGNLLSTKLQSKAA
ncbi:hypothetical protein [Polaribacter sp. Q13]|uniref:hypothetical protein n=1 Tax=Polaribacter sp. Q13 TaxID=2806551 RepID=UPI00193B8BDF|nr:hypothetical protein [Polaribacter sp. Q13]QVY64900.1 hypothetical protein JOP69_14165 [Polaribacter sp. Q13]